MSSIFATSPLGLVARWSTSSQEQARRNAMAACTVLTARRIERVEVEEFVAAHLARRVQTATKIADQSTTTTTAAPARHVS
ncbi:hypothetical protein ABIE44_000547 [Marmoricola sp. OAE513]|uniref:hypothetical protein n=1 Tax=Marmoricola sp. OAE513 TaxID=2817894 RepID=UPI001AE26CB9